METRVRLSEFAENTTCHGIASVHRSRTRLWRLVWTLALLAAFGVMVYQIWTLFDRYRSYPASTKVQVKNSPLPFPSVTVCNQNPLHYQDMIYSRDPEVGGLYGAVTNLQQFEIEVAAKEEAKAAQLLEEERRREREETGGSDDKTALDMEEERMRWELERPVIDVPPDPDKDVPADPDIDVSADPEYPVLGQPGFGVDDNMLDFSKNKSQDRLLREAVSMERHKLPKNMTLKLGHKAANLIQKCRFFGRDCSHTNFTQFVAPGYGLCYTFNSVEMTKEDVLVKRSGPGYGLSLMLNIESGDYMPVLSSAIGARVTIHERGSFPFPGRRGYSVPVGYQTDIGISVRYLNRLSDPYGNCSKFLNAKHQKYDDEVCKTKCIHERIVEKCGCYTYYKYDTARFLPVPTVRKCVNDTDILCAMRVDLDYEQQSFDCPCPQPCLETEYLTSSSLNQWPTAGYLPVLTEQLCEREEELVETKQSITPICEILKNDGIEYAQKNILALTVYFKHLNYESITEEPDYPLPNFLSDVGGTMGLYAGISLLTGIEIVALAIGLLNDLFKLITTMGKRESKKSFDDKQAGVNLESDLANESSHV